MVGDGLRLLKEKEEIHRAKIEEPRREVRIGIDQADHGQTKYLTDDFVQDIKAWARLGMTVRLLLGT